MRFSEGQKTYIAQLWNGEYFRYDTAANRKTTFRPTSWLDSGTQTSPARDIVPHSMQVSAMKKIFDVNVMKFGGGEMGAANGMAADGAILSNAEAKEVWVEQRGLCRLLMSEG